MKNFIIVLFIIHSVLIFSQEEREVSKVEAYLNLLENYNNSVDKILSIQSLTKDEILEIAKLEYEAIEEDNIAVQTFIIKQHIFVESVYKIKPLRRIGAVKGMFEQRMGELFSYKLQYFIDVPYYIRAKILSKELIREKLEYFPYEDVRTEYKILIESSLKGNSKFVIGDTAVFFIGGPNWPHPKHGKHLVVGESFLLQLDARAVSDYNYSRHALLTYIDESAGIFPIENEVVSDYYNFFEFGEKIEWNEFAHRFNEKVNAIKNKKIN